MAPALRAKNNFHIVDVVSTVMPGSCGAIFRPLLERATGKRCESDFGLVYNPELIALGSVIRNFLNPDMVLIGASDVRSGSAVCELYASTCKTSPTMAVMSLVNAEITKISLNCYITMKISYAKESSAICEQVPGAEVCHHRCHRCDRRVGSKCLKGGLGSGGPCFPRDNIAFQVFAEESGAKRCWPRRSLRSTTAYRSGFSVRYRNTGAPPAKVALLGLSYKADTHIIEKSHSIMLAKTLVAAGYQVALHDPAALDA